MAPDVQAMQYIQAKLVLAIYCQRQARRLLFMSLLMGCHRKCKGRIFFILALVYYARKVRITKTIIGVDFFS